MYSVLHFNPYSWTGLGNDTGEMYRRDAKNAAHGIMYDIGMHVTLSVTLLHCTRLTSSAFFTLALHGWQGVILNRIHVQLYFPREGSVLYNFTRMYNFPREGSVCTPSQRKEVYVQLDFPREGVVCPREGTCATFQGKELLDGVWRGARSKSQDTCKHDGRQVPKCFVSYPL
jgi:hypothetical protein